jgi:vitamin B12/bleomycin/antimicrobial peptide transport system ATP-binding/permease protein
MAQLLCLLRALCHSRYRSRLGAFALLLLAVVGANTYGQIRLNAWNGSFYDTLERRSWWLLGSELGTFLIICGGLLLLVVAQTWLQEMIKIRLREWLTHHLLDDWLAPKRAYLLSHAGEVGVNPDQRVQDDAKHLAELTASLAFGLLQATLLLVTFVGVLWVLSSQVVFTLNKQPFTVPGYMVWCALFYAAAGSWLTWLVGRPLIRLNAERCAREADFRFALVRVHESAEAIALHRGERDEREILNGSVTGVVHIGREIARGVARLTWVTSGYGWLALVVPVLVASPGYFNGAMTLGGLMMVVGAFNQVQQSLRWFVDNFATIATWRATLLRVMAFRDGLSHLGAAEQEEAAANETRIAVGAHPEGKLAFKALSLALRDGRAEFDAPVVEIERGERVLIVSEPCADKGKLLRAIAGLLTRGEGTILLPPAHEVMFVPARPYMPLTTLRAAVTYPDDAANFADSAVYAALERVGLEHLIPRLAERERWDKILQGDEQQSVALARLILHAPRWVFVEDTTAAMNEEHHFLLRSIFSRELAHATLVSCTTSPALEGFYTRTIALRGRSADVEDARTKPAARPVAYPASIAA